MKNIKLPRTLILSGYCLFATIVLAFAAFEFYLWASHDFSPDYGQKQRCIEDSTLYDNKICQKFRNEKL